MKVEYIFFMGTGKVGSDCLRILKNASGMVPLQCLSVEVEQIPTMEPLCRKLDVPYVRLSPLELKEYILQHKGQIIVISAHNEFLFPKEIVEQPNIRIINFHNAYLPDYRGRNAPTWEIYEDASYGGATWHVVDATVDTGGIIVQEKVAIEKDETALSLLMKCAKAGISLMREHVNEFLCGKYKAVLPDREGKLYLAKNLPNNGFLDTAWDIEQAYRFLRSMDYRPMDIMPLPKLVVGDKVYEIDDYEIRQSNGSSIDNSKQFCISSHKGDMELICSIKEL